MASGVGANDSMRRHCEWTERGMPLTRPWRSALSTPSMIRGRADREREASREMPSQPRTQDGGAKLNFRRGWSRWRRQSERTRSNRALDRHRFLERWLSCRCRCDPAIVAKTVCHRLRSRPAWSCRSWPDFSSMRRHAAARQGQPGRGGSSGMSTPEYGRRPRAERAAAPKPARTPSGGRPMYPSGGGLHPPTSRSAG